MITPSTMLKSMFAANNVSGLPSRPLRSTTLLVINPKMPIGEKEPALAPFTTIRPIGTGLRWWRRARPVPMGAIIATAAGPTAPTAVTAAVTKNMAQGTRETRPCAARIATSTSQSTVPLFLAMANRNVTPVSTMNRSPGNPPTMLSTFAAGGPGNTNIPRMNAAEIASAPRWIGNTVAMRKIAASTRMDASSTDMSGPRAPGE
jgi:hypothetical protein